MSQRLGNALAEIDFLIKNYNRESTDNIPVDFLNFVEDFKNKDYKVNIDVNRELVDQDLLKETRLILAFMYKEYFATDSEKKRFNKEEIEKLLEKEKIKQEKWNRRHKERTIENINKKENNEDNKIIYAEEKSLFKVILNKLKTIFKK